MRPATAISHSFRCEALVQPREGPAKRPYVDSGPHHLRFFNIEIHERREVTAQHVLNGVRVRRDDDWNCRCGHGLSG